jgi:hypothetical protein
MVEMDCNVVFVENTDDDHELLNELARTFCEFGSVATTDNGIPLEPKGVVVEPDIWGTMVATDNDDAVCGVKPPYIVVGTAR